VDGPAEIRNLNLPNANHNALFQINASVQWRLLLVSYRRFGIAHQPNFQWSSRIKPLKMEPIGCPETSVTNYQSTMRNIPEDRRRQITIFVASSILTVPRRRTEEPRGQKRGIRTRNHTFKRSKILSTSVTSGSYLRHRHARPM
jgi:hypothetical protein